jgi:transcriptional regulator with XRE-family HTH domain
MKNLVLSEDQLIENVINKLQVYMKKHNMTLHNLATTIGFCYQPFQRLIKNKRLPAMSSLIMIANYLNYTLGDLLSDKICLDVNIIDEMSKVEVEKSGQIGKAVIQYDLIAAYATAQIIGFKTFKHEYANFIRIFAMIDRIDSDGEFIVNYMNKIVTLVVTSVSSKFIIVESNKEEKKIAIEEIRPIARFIGDAILIDEEVNYINGVL